MLTVNQLVTSCYPLKTAWNGLTRRLQTVIETCRVTNGSVNTLARGTVVRMSADRTVVEAQADSEANSRAIGVMTESVAPNQTGICRNDNVGFVLFDDGAVPVCGDWAYVSPTVAGLATTAAGGPGWYYTLGLVCDASMYATTGGCLVLLGRSQCSTLQHEDQQ